jgi:DNA-binding HxlR family transcriptional regulator
MWQVVSAIEEPPESLQFASRGTLGQLLARCKYYRGMRTRTAGPRSGCPINAAVEVIGDPWSLLVLRDVMFGNRRHFRALQELSEESIASNILADRLRRLRDTGLLTRADVGRGRRAIYSLTEAAIELVPVMAALGAWGLRNRPTSPTLRARAELLADGGPELWEDFMAELRAKHLGAEPPPHDRPRATERLATAYADAVAADAGWGLGATTLEAS